MQSFRFCSAIPNKVALPLKTNIYVRQSTADYVKLANAIKESLAALQIQVEVIAVPSGFYTTVGKGKHQMCINDWFGDNGDPDNFLSVLLNGDNTKFDDNLNASDVAMIPIAHTQAAYVTQPSVSGLVVNPLNFAYLNLVSKK